jgi:hypothetical protein
MVIKKSIASTLALFATVLFLGAGCAPVASEETPTPESAVQQEQSASSSSANQTEATTAETSSTVEATGSLKALPAIVPSPKLVEDDKTWQKTTTKSGVTLTYPTKGAYAPTWTYAILASDDAHLKGDCYVTEKTVYQRTDFPGITGSCQTTTEFGSGPGTRTDYYVFHYGDKTHLFTFTKVYAAGFDMDGYGAVLEHVIGIID